MSRAVAAGVISVREVPVEVIRHVEVPVEVRVIEHVDRIVAPKGTQWATLLNVLAQELGGRAIDLDSLAGITAAADDMAAALNRRLQREYGELLARDGRP